MAHPEPAARPSTTGAPTAPGWYPHPRDPSWEMYWDGGRWSRSRRPERDPAEVAALGGDSPMPLAEKAALTGAGLVAGLFVLMVVMALLALVAIALAAGSMNAGL